MTRVSRRPIRRGRSSGRGRSRWLSPRRAKRCAPWARLRRRAISSQAYLLYAQMQNVDGMARMQAELGSTEIDLSNYEEALKYYRQADTLMEKIGSPDRADLLI